MMAQASRADAQGRWSRRTISSVFTAAADLAARHLLVSVFVFVVASNESRRLPVMVASGRVGARERAPQLSGAAVGSRPPDEPAVSAARVILMARDAGRMPKGQS